MKESTSRSGTCIGVGLGVLIGATDWSIVQNALPTIQNSLGASIGQLQWIMNSFGLFMTVLLVTMGRLGDIYGRKRIFNLGLLIFGLASLGAALSSTPFGLIVARAFQGVGFAMLMTTSQALLTHAFPEDQHGHAMGIWATLAGIGLVLGPVLGGIIVSFLPWSWIFYINIPITIISYIFVKIFVVESKNEEHPPVLDIKGIIIFTLGLGFLIFGIIEGPGWGWSNPFILACFALAIIFLLVFYFVERKTKVPLIQFSFFKNRRFTAAALTIFTGCFLFWATFFLMPLYLQNFRNESPWVSGLVLLSVGIPFTIISRFAGAAGDRIDKQKLIPSGLFLVLLFAISVLWIGDSVPLILICLGLVFFGAGQAIFWAPGTSLGISALPRSQSGVASGAITTIQETGGSVGIALAGTIFRVTEKHHFQDLVDNRGMNLSSEVIAKAQSLLSDPEKLKAFLTNQVPSLDHIITDLFKASFLFGFHSSMILTAALSFVSMVSIYFLLKKKHANVS